MHIVIMSVLSCNVFPFRYSIFVLQRATSYTDDYSSSDVFVNSLLEHHICKNNMLDIEIMFSTYNCIIAIWVYY